MKNIFLLILLMCVWQLEGKPTLFEGDIVLDERTRPIVQGDSTFDAVINAAKKWPGAKVPYIFASNFDNYRRKVVKTAIADYNRYTCIRFVPRTNERNYVRFMIGGGCYSQVGVSGGQQDISIGPRCYYKGTVIHEMMHAVGFWHEQSRLDRDNYVIIYWQNIPVATRYNFKKYRHGEADYYGEPYDYNSVMHYPKNAFGIGGRITIAAKGNPSKVLGQRNGFSQIDVKQLNKVYKCKGGGGGGGGGKGKCEDGNRSCSYWAARRECQKNPGWMLKNCKKSCGKCEKTNCTDKSKHCPYWAKTGYCRTNDWTQKNCKKSCKKC